MANEQAPLSFGNNWDSGFGLLAIPLRNIDWGTVILSTVVEKQV